MEFTEILKVILLGIVEGITEWLPISSTGHIVLVDTFIPLRQSDAFKNMFNVVIQLGAILAVVVLFWKKLFPFQWKDKEKPVVQKDIFKLWGKVIIACIPAGVVGIIFDKYEIDQKISTPLVIAAMLILYGIAFIVVENKYKDRVFKINTTDEIDWQPGEGPRVVVPCAEDVQRRRPPRRRGIHLFSLHSRHVRREFYKNRQVRIKERRIRGIGNFRFAAGVRRGVRRFPHRHQIPDEFRQKARL